MESTRVTPKRTAADITTLLIETGAESITMDHDIGGQITGMRFTLRVQNALVPFRLPLRVEPVYETLHNRRIKTQRWKADSFIERDREQAERVAWRQLLRWIQAQLAMIQTGMARSEELFLPYMQDAHGQTLFEHIRVGGYAMIGPPKETEQ
jgi:hypothetical protein